MIDDDPRATLRMKQSIDGFARITIDPESMNGQPCIRGMRVAVRRVLEMLPGYPDWASLIKDYPDSNPKTLSKRCVSPPSRWTIRCWYTERPD